MHARDVLKQPDRRRHVGIVVLVAMLAPASRHHRFFRARDSASMLSFTNVMLHRVTLMLIDLVRSTWFIREQP